MKVRYEFVATTNLEVALHDTLLEFNRDLAACTVSIAANADITFKPCQVSSSAQVALQNRREAVEVDLPEFLRLLNGMVQIVDGHVTIRRSRMAGPMIFELRVVDSSFALVETDNQAVLRAFESRFTGAQRSERKKG